MKIVAGIVLYNPNIKRLNSNLNAVAPQVDEVILFDNGSDNIKEIRNYLNQKDIVYKLKQSNKNKGIAHALNQICRLAKAEGYKWILTLDQDTVIYPNLIKEYSSYLTLPRVAQLSCVYKDRNSTKLKDIIENKIVEVDECITSGTLLNLDALEEVGGFDERMFIDYVDFDLCYALKKKEYKTYRIAYVGMLHEIGNITTVRFFNKKIEIFNQSAFRHYYRCRNFFLFAKRYNLYSLPRAFYMQFKEMVKVILYETHKASKLKAMINGTSDGIKMSSRRKNYFD
ncbi:glycosyltransferase family 2 protein [Lactobacillus intestinalis]|uniref:glycosyltransferase family 2 protein n=1 Tax=Lactobacillus intestinalis TaxID=151781 RepID=UPI001F5AC62F|nr:glycosyltransferase family 2 protein [Lactobacillus intestinalis]